MKKELIIDITETSKEEKEQLVISIHQIVGDKYKIVKRDQYGAIVDEFISNKGVDLTNFREQYGD